MIYALLNRNQNLTDCQHIAVAIRDKHSSAIQIWVARKVIVHAMQAIGIGRQTYCLYCRDEVSLSDSRTPEHRTAALRWHFEHRAIADCIGEIRNPPTPFAIGVLNPSNHGCYVCLGCETAPERHRTQCQTIENGMTYCHLGNGMALGCLPNP